MQICLKTTTKIGGHVSVVKVSKHFNFPKFCLVLIIVHQINNNNNNDVLYSAGIRLKEGAHGAFAENIMDKYSIVLFCCDYL